MDAPAITRSFRPSSRGLDYSWPGTSVREACVRYGFRPDEVVKLASNENPFGTPPHAVAAAARAAQQASVYPSPGYDYADLRRALAGYAGVSPDMIMPGPGSETIVGYLSRLFIDPGDEVITAPESYDGYGWAAGIMAAEVRPVSLVDYRYDVDAILAAVTGRTRIIWVCNPNNPTGAILPSAQTRRLLESVPATTAVVFDEAYREFVDDPEYGDGLDLLLAGHRNVIVLRTLSKAFGLAAMRIGYAIADPAVCAALDSLSEPFHISGPACAAAIAAVNDDRAWFEDKRDYLVAERRRLERSLAELGVGVVPSQGNFILFDTGSDAMGLYERLMRQGVIVRLGCIWTYDTHLRVTVGTREQNDRMLTALAAALHG